MFLNKLSEIQKITLFGAAARGRPPKIKKEMPLVNDSIDNLDPIMNSIIDSKKSKFPISYNKTTNKNVNKTLGFRDSRIYQMGMWPMAIVSTIIGFATNIQASKEIIENYHQQQQEDDKYGTYQKNNNWSQNAQERRYAITAQNMRPIMRLAANPAKSVITFGMPWFF